MAGTPVSLLLPNFNNERILPLVLGRLSEHTTYPDVELVVVDDGSTDGSRDVLRAWRDGGSFIGPVRLIEQPNGGAIDALNTALQAASGEVCVQLDSDASIETPGWLERMLALLTSDERVGVVTVKVVMDDGRLHACGVNVVGPAGLHDRPSVLREPAGRRRWPHRVDRLREGEGGAAETRPAEVDAGIGCCLMYRRADALAAGGYDRRYSPVWFDDTDLCLGIRALGRKVLYLPDVRVVHRIVRRDAPVGRERLHPRRFARALVRHGARRMPSGARARVEERFDLDLDLHHTPAQRARLDHHYAAWQDKWGWDPRNPDLDAIAARWGGTEVAWSLDPERRAAGEAILRAYAERTLTGAA